MTRLPDSERTRIVLVGTHRYTKLEQLPAVLNNLMALQKLFASSDIWNLPTHHCAVVQNPERPRQISEPLRNAAREATDTVVFYFAGHGLIDPASGELYLALRDSDQNEVYDSAVPYEWVRRELVASRASRRIVILDCCYSGRALGVMSAGINLAVIDGSYLLAATAENGLALAPPGEKFTAFTGELIRVADSGVQQAGRELTLNEMYDAICSSLGQAQRPKPQCRDRNAVGKTHFIPNMAYRQPLKGTRQGIGVVAPFAFALDRELWQFAPENVSLHVTRLPFFTSPPTVEMAVASADRRAVRRATRDVLSPNPGVVAFVCAECSFVEGAAGEEVLRRTIEDAGAPAAVTTSGALIEALRLLEAFRLAIATPYIGQLANRLVAYLAEHGVMTVSREELDNEWLTSEPTPTEIIEVISAADDPQADALLISGVNLPTYDLIEPLEQVLGKPVLTSNQITIWAALRMVGLKTVGGGTLLKMQ